MAEDIAHIAIVSPNAAFSAFTESVLANWPDLAVDSFSGIEALADTLFVPSVIACNFEFNSDFYRHFAPVLAGFRQHHPVATLATVRRVQGWTRANCRVFGIDEVVVKPISPLHLGLRLADLATDRTSAYTPSRQSAEILPFPARRRVGHAPGFHPYVS